MEWERGREGGRRGGGGRRGAGGGGDSDGRVTVKRDGLFSRAGENMLIFVCGWLKLSAQDNAFSRAGDSPAPVPLFSRAVLLTDRMKIKGDGVQKNGSCSSENQVRVLDGFSTKV